MDDRYYEVLYNTCYGGFGFPDDFVDDVFERYPPHSEIGKELFKPCNYSTFYQEHETPNPEHESYYIIHKTRPYKHDYVALDIKPYYKKPNNYNIEVDESNYVTRDFKNYYYVECNRWSWRKNPHIIQLALEKDIIGKKIGYSKLAIAKVPKFCNFDIDDYDGMESIDVNIPYTSMLTNLLEYIWTQDESKLDDLSKALVKKVFTLPELMAKCRAYDHDEGEDD